MALMYCRECGQRVSSEAPTCPHCGVPAPVLLPDGRPAAVAVATRAYVPRAVRAPRDGGLAGVLSFVLPGAGQLYRGKVGRGFAWMFFVVVGYMALIVPGLFLHGLCIHNAVTRE